MASPNADKDSRTIVPGIWKDVMRTYDNLPAARLLTTTLTQNEIAIIEGDFFRAFRVFTIPANGKTYMSFTSPPASAGTIFGLVAREFVPSISGIWYRVYRGATGVVEGDAWDIFNENGLSPKVATSTFKDVVSVVSLGDISDIAYSPAGAVGTKVKGSLERTSGFKIIPPDTPLLIEFENLNNASNEVLVYYEFIEAPAAISVG